MNLKVNELPENWTPGCTKSINRWFRMIHGELRKNKGLNKINKNTYK